jgi:methionine synthase II (cobalamin-independent)
MEITKDITIEELVDLVPGSVRYLSVKGIKCIACGEPIWGTLEEAAKEKGFSDQEIAMFVEDLNELKDNPEPDPGTHIDVKKI